MTVTLGAPFQAEPTGVIHTGRLIFFPNGVPVFEPNVSRETLGSSNAMADLAGVYEGPNTNLQ
jgi:uncharacterized RmlC-like cupin family protein